MAATHLAALRAAARECQLAAASFSDEQAAEGLTAIDELRAYLLPRPASSSSQAAALLMQLPFEILSVILSMLGTRELARLAASCRFLRSDAPTPQPPPVPPRQVGLVEAELRRRADVRGLDVGSSLPEGVASWVPYLLKRDRRNARMRQAPLAVGDELSMFVDTEGGLLTCGIDMDCDTPLLGHAEDPDADPDEPREIGPPTLVLSMQDRRIISVASSYMHCLALSADGEVYSWGDGYYGVLGLDDEVGRAVPCRIESLSCIERIAVGPYDTSAAVDQSGKLFTWGRATALVEGFVEDEDGEVTQLLYSNGLGHELDAETECQLTPKRVEALLQERVVDVALGYSFTLAVTDAGAVFSFGYCEEGELGHGSLASVVLPRRIEILAQTGRRFVAVAAGNKHVLALTEEGELYGWGNEKANGHGSEAAHLGGYERTPRRVAAFGRARIKLVYAWMYSSCAVTEKGELFTWGYPPVGTSLGHGDDGPQFEPKRVEGLSGVKVAAAAIGGTHGLAADEDGVVWAFGQRAALGLGASGPEAIGHVRTPIPIPTLRVRVLDSP